MENVKIYRDESAGLRNGGPITMDLDRRAGPVLRKAKNVQSFDRGLKLLEALNAQSVTSLDALHLATDIPKPTIVRLLGTLIGAGYVRRVSRSSGYALTHGVLRLSSGMRQRDVLVDLALPLMEAFTREHKWQLNLGTREWTTMLIRATTYTTSPFQQETNGVSHRCSVLQCAMGRAYIASCSASEREAILQTIRTSNTPISAMAWDADKIEQIIQTVRTERYATIRPLSKDDSYRRLAIPVMAPDSRDDVLAVLAMYWYPSVMTVQEAAGKYLGQLYFLAEQISMALKVELASISSEPLESKTTVLI